VQKHVQRPATYDDLLRVPDHLVAEIVDGELYANPRPAGPHARATTALGIILGAAFDLNDRGWWYIDEPELHLAGEVVVSDIAGWRRERMPPVLDAPWYDLAPAWVCEALSPGTARLDRFKKMPTYAREAVDFAWIIDATMRSLEAFRLEHGQWVVIAQHTDDAIVRVEPFEEIEINLGKLWLPTPQPQQS